MAYDLYPAVDPTYNFPPEVRNALAKSLDLRNTVIPMTTIARNNLTAPELWDGRTIVNTDTDRIQRYDLGTLAWYSVAEYAEMVAADLAVTTDTRLHLGLRNKIRNGDMSVAQRGNGPFSLSGMTVDGYRFFMGGNATGTLSRVVFPAATQTLKWDITVNLITPASISTDYGFIEISTEDVRTLAGKVCTLSLRGVSSTTNRVLGVSIRQNFGTGGSPSGITDTPIGILSPLNVPMDTPAGYLTLTFTMPSIVAKTIGSNEDSSVSLRIWFAVGSFNLATSGFQNAAQGNQAAFSCALSEIQLEEGPVATPFERLPQQMQLAWCQRYFWRINPLALSTPISSGLMVSTVAGYFPIALPLTMRSIPSIPAINATGWMAVFGAGGVSAVSSIVPSVISPQFVRLDVVLGTPITAGSIAQLTTHSSITSTPIDFASEL
jgi:hypothetical protein